MKARSGPLLDCLYSKKTSFQLKNGKFTTSFRGGLLLSLLPLLLLTISTAQMNEVAFYHAFNEICKIIH